MRDKLKKFEHYFTSRPSSRPKYGLIRTYLRGRQFEFLTASSVFSRRRVDLGTRLLVESMILPEEGYVLDMGCGYGVVGIVAAKLNPALRVIMVDVNERAVKLASRNIILNRVANAEARFGHLYEPVEGVSFNCILSNPPISAGLSMVKSIISEAPKHMVRGATLQMVVKSKIGKERLQRIFEENFGNVSVLARGSGYRVLMSEKIQ